MKKLQKKSLGFTILEVMIVLAIASLIVVMVLLAVSAANRSSRDTKRRADALQLSQALEEWAQNNSGALPTQTADIAINPLVGTLDPAKPFCDQNFLPNHCNEFKDPSGYPHAFIQHSFEINPSPMPTITCSGAGASAPGIMLVTYTSARDYKIQMCTESGGVYTLTP